MINGNFESIVIYFLGQIIYFLIFCIIFGKIIFKIVIIAFKISFFAGRKNGSSTRNIPYRNDNLLHKCIIHFVYKKLVVFINHIATIFCNKTHIFFYIFEIMGNSRHLSATRRNKKNISFLKFLIDTGKVLTNLVF